MWCLMNFLCHRVPPSSFPAVTYLIAHYHQTRLLFSKHALELSKLKNLIMGDTPLASLSLTHVHYVITILFGFIASS